MLKISEIFYSIQGEGPELGMPAVFIRLSGCNLDCPWCDTKYAEHGVNMSEEEIISDVDSHNCENIVITGGEPLIQDILPLIKELKLKSKKVYVETNGTVFKPELIGFAIFIVSPKLKYAGRIQHSYLRNLYRWSHLATFKFVIDTMKDFDDSIELIKKLKIIQPAYFMPQVTDDKEMKEKIIWLTELVKENYSQVRVAPRLQIYLYGMRKGK